MEQRVRMLLVGMAIVAMLCFGVGMNAQTPAATTTTVTLESANAPPAHLPTVAQSAQNSFSQNQANAPFTIMNTSGTDNAGVKTATEENTNANTAINGSPGVTNYASIPITDPNATTATGGSTAATTDNGNATTFTPAPNMINLDNVPRPQAAARERPIYNPGPPWQSGARAAATARQT